MKNLRLLVLAGLLFVLCSVGSLVYLLLVLIRYPRTALRKKARDSKTRE